MSFLPGVAMVRPWPAVMLEDSGLVQATTMLRELHDATADLVLPPETEWRTGAAGKGRGQIIRHGDLGPWNTLWQDGVLTGLVDWDPAEPGYPLTDLAQLAYYFVPLRGDRGWQEAGFGQVPDYLQRLAVVCNVYGTYGPAELVVELDRFQQWEIERTCRLADEGRSPWCQWLQDDEVAEWESDNLWLREHFRPIFTD